MLTLGRACLAGLALAATLSVAGRAAEPALAPPPSEPREMSGIWYGVGNNDPNNGRYDPIGGGERPFTAEGKAIYDRRATGAAAGAPERQPADDCLPHGVPAALRLPTPLQIIQTPGQTTFIHEASRNVRLVYMDEPQPAKVEPTFLGHSVGHWEGDTLVVDTIGLRHNWLDITGAPMSEQMHLTERWKMLDRGKKLEVVFTVDDPKMYSRPWSARREYLWSPEERVMEYVCEEFDRIEPGAARGDYK